MLRIAVSLRAWLHGQRLAVVSLLLLALVPAPLLAGGALAAEEGPDRWEAAELRTATSKTFHHRDGRITKQLFSGPVHFRDGGRWKEIDPTLAPAGADDRDRGFGWQMRSHGFDVLVKHELAGEFLKLDVAGLPFGFSLDGARPQAAVARGSEVTFPDALEGVDLRYEMHSEGVKEELVLKDADAPSRYRFVVHTMRGLHLRAIEQPNGGFEFRGRGGGRPLFTLAPPFATDAPDGRSRRGARTMRQDRDRRDHASMSVERLDNGDFAVELAVDPVWLDDPDRRFPVTVDPTITFQPTTQDANFEGNCSTCEGWDSDILDIGTDDVSSWRAGLQFDLGQVPPGAAVSSARLSLFSPAGWCVWTSSEACGARSHALNVHKMTKAWSWASTTGALGWDATAAATTTEPAGVTSDHWISFDMLSLAQSWVSGAAANHGVLVKRATEPLDVGGPEVAARLWEDPAQRPKLEITYSSNAVRFPAPDTLHGNGAELRWDRFDGSTGAAFSSYEVHRSTLASFTPSETTRLATIRDAATTSFRDTTAAPSRSFTYKIVTNGSPSVGQTVTLPADGQARKVLQPEPAAGSTTWLENLDGAADCSNYGAEEFFEVGNDGYAERGLLKFDLRGIPAGATVTGATLSAFMTEAPWNPITVGAHRMTAAWNEGAGRYECTSDGASWAKRDGVSRWTTAGGDYVATPEASKSHLTTDAPGWDAFAITSAVQSWVNGTAPNHGVMLRASTEAPGTNKGAWVPYHSDDYTGSPTLRPKLSVDYADAEAKALPPTTAISAPVASEQVSGTTTVDAAVTDDRRVDKVEFLVDGVLKTTDTAAPYAYAWDTKTATNAAHSITVRATDDAGNVKTSPATSVTVANSAPPATRVTSPTSKYEDLVKADGPSAFWRLGETAGTAAADASGNGRGATLSGAYLLAQPSLLTGDLHTAAKLQNATTDGRLTATTLGTLLGGHLTAEAWVSYAAIVNPAAVNTVLSRGWGAAGGWRLALVKNAAGAQTAELAINNAGTVVTATAAVTPGKLHLAGTYDGATLRLYVNGGQVATAATATPVPLTTTASVLSGATLDTDTTVDEAALFGRALTATELKAHSEVGAGRAVSVKGQHTVQAAASDDGSVAKVEFYVDGNRFGEDATSPYAATLSTLGAEPVYDGTHQLTTKAYDNHGQVTASAAENVTVANAAGTKYLADVTSTAMPQAVIHDPQAATQDQHGLDVTVTNRSAQTWSATDVVVRPRWLSPDPTVQTVLGTEVPLGVALAPGASKVVRVMVEAPALPDGVERAQYKLQVDAFEKSTSSFFADKGNKPLENPVIVSKALRMALGLEKYYDYDGQHVGAGMQHMLNVGNGNSLLRWTPLSSPGRGLSTVLDVTYNALEKKSESPIGNNFSLSISGLTRFGNPIDIHPNKADEIAGRANRFVEITDGDGTTHRFVGKQAADGSVYWEEPDGVHLHLRSLATTDTRGRWAFTRPDRVTFFYDVDGFPTMIEDANGNRLTYTLEATPAGEDPGGPKKRITAVTDAAGQGATPAANRSFRLTYWSKADAKKAHVRGKLKRVTDHSGSALDFEYYDDGNLRRLVQRGGVNPDGTALADRAFVFTYTTSNGDAAAIPLAADRANPDAKVSNQSTRLFSVRDPRGKETTFAYLGTGNGQDRWKLASRTDRDGEQTAYAYDTLSRVTTVTSPLTRVTKFGYDIEGKPLTVTDPRGDKLTLAWTADRHVSRVTEPTGRFTEYAYDANGYLTDEWDQKRQHTKLEYDYVATDPAADVAGRWKTGRAVPHISQLRKKTDPNGMATATAGDYEWEFTYDAKGNELKVIDPLENFTERFPNADGTLAWIKDENGNQTTFPSYDPSGQPAEILDAEGNRTRFGYDVDGQLTWVQDPLHADATGAAGTEREFRAYFDYDPFHRMARQSAPKWTAGDRGTLVWSGASYDANDNLSTQIAAHEGRDWTGTGAKTTFTHDVMDRRTLETGPDTKVDPAGERQRWDYDRAGRLIRHTLPKGVMTTVTDKDFATEYEYDAADRLLRQLKPNVDGTTVKETLVTHYCYDAASDLKWVVPPRAGVASVDCTATTKPRFASEFTYDEAHRQLSSVDAGHGVDGVTKHTKRQEYDANGNVRFQVDERGTRTELKYDQVGRMTDVVAPHNRATGRNVTTRFEYDKSGNRTRVISPRAWDASSDKSTFTDFVTKFTYDKVDRQVRVDLPKGPETTDVQRYVHSRYDANGNMVAQSLPVTALDPGANLFDGVSGKHKTTVSYYDTGWIKTQNAPGTPRVRFEYSPEGWQKSRTPETDAGVERTDRRVRWEYFLDGGLKAEYDRNGDPTTYEYDANNNLTLANDVSGAQTDGETAVDVRITRDGLDRETLTKHQKRNSTRWLATKYTEYDLDGNVKERVDNLELDAAGAQVKQGRRHRYDYDDSGWLTEQVDFGRKDAAETDKDSDDRRTRTAYFPTGWEQERTIAKRSGADFTDVKQRTTWDYFDDGKLKALRTRNGADATIESHDVEYLDAAGRFLNGHRVKDTFSLRGPKQDAKCRDIATPCVTKYEYDARDKLTKEVRERNGINRNTSYTYDTQGNLDVESRHDGLSIDSDYDGQRVTQQKFTKSGALPFTKKFRYDLDGNLDCTFDGTDAATTDGVCNTADSRSGTKLLEKYDYDPLNRLKRKRSWDGAAVDDDTTYVYDALDRLITEDEKHGTSGSDQDRVTSFAYLGTSQDVVEERRAYKQGPKAGTNGPQVKTYAYDAHGNRIGMTDERPGRTTKDYTYGTDVHGSVSLLIDEAGQAKAQYGYTPYGEKDDDLTQEIDPDKEASTPTGVNIAHEDDTVNPYRYTGMRHDTGSESIDMGARRFGPEIGQFLQRDSFEDALDDVELGTDALTGNRYSLAGGNPVSFVETDGHMLRLDGGGGAVSSPRPRRRSTSSSSSSGSSVSRRPAFRNSIFAKPVGEIGSSQWQAAQLNARREQAREDYLNEPAPGQTTLSRLFMGEVDREGDAYCGIRGAECEEMGGGGAAAKALAKPALKLAGKAPKLASGRALAAGASRAASRVQPQFRSFTPRNFRHNLILRTGKDPGKAAQAHHAFPKSKEFSQFFKNKGIEVNNPKYGTWWESVGHNRAAQAYNRQWRLFIQTNRNASTDDVLQFGRELNKGYGVKTGF